MVLLFALHSDVFEIFDFHTEVYHKPHKRFAYMFDKKTTSLNDRLMQTFVEEEEKSLTTLGMGALDLGVFDNPKPLSDGNDRSNDILSV